MAPRPDHPLAGWRVCRARPVTPLPKPAVSAESESGAQQQSLRSDRGRDQSTRPSQSHQQSVSLEETVVHAEAVTGSIYTG